MNSSSAPQVNPQVQKAVEAASKAYNTGAAHVKRVAGPVGEKLGGALGGRSTFRAVVGRGRPRGRSQAEDAIHHRAID